MNIKNDILDFFIIVAPFSLRIKYPHAPDGACVLRIVHAEVCNLLIRSVVYLWQCTGWISVQIVFKFFHI